MAERVDGAGKNSIHGRTPPTFLAAIARAGTSGFKPLWKSYCDSTVTISRYIRCHFRRLSSFPRSPATASHSLCTLACKVSQPGKKVNSEHLDRFTVISLSIT